MLNHCDTTRNMTKQGRELRPCLALVLWAKFNAHAFREHLIKPGRLVPKGLLTLCFALTLAPFIEIKVVVELATHRQGRLWQPSNCIRTCFVSKIRIGVLDLSPHIHRGQCNGKVQ